MPGSAGRLRCRRPAGDPDARLQLIVVLRWKLPGGRPGPRLRFVGRVHGAQTRAWPRSKHAGAASRLEGPPRRPRWSTRRGCSGSQGVRVLLAGHPLPHGPRRGPNHRESNPASTVRAAVFVRRDSGVGQGLGGFTRVSRAATVPIGRRQCIKRTLWPLRTGERHGQQAVGAACSCSPARRNAMVGRYGG